MIGFIDEEKDIVGRTLDPGRKGVGWHQPAGWIIRADQVDQYRPINCKRGGFHGAEIHSEVLAHWDGLISHPPVDREFLRLPIGDGGRDDGRPLIRPGPDDRVDNLRGAVGDTDISGQEPFTARQFRAQSSDMLIGIAMPQCQGFPGGLDGAR